MRSPITHDTSFSFVMPATFPNRLLDIVKRLEKEFAGIRTGRATPALLDGVRVESYGVPLTLTQVGSITVEDARTVRIIPWDAAQIPAVEKAVRDANLGVSLVVDGGGVRVVFPELTGERRRELTKIAKQKLEDARVAVRSARDEAIKEIEKQFKGGGMGEDEKFTRKDAVQKHVDETNKALETLYAKKAEELEA
jgi:ribosome recycling factor